MSVTTIDRAVRSGVLRTGGTPHRRLFKQVWLDAWLGAFLLLLALLLLGCLLDVECACDLASVG